MMNVIEELENHLYGDSLLRSVLGSDWSYDLSVDDGEISLISACKSGDSKTVEELVNSGVIVDARDRSNFFNQFIGFTQSALLVAVTRGHANVVETLVRKGAEIQLRDRFGFNALHLACRNGHYDCVDVLLRYNADVTAVRQDGERAIHYAAVSGNSELVKLLIRYGANPNESDVYGYSPLSYAASHGHIDTCRVLFENGAIAKSRHISMAYKKCYAEIVLFLFLHATDIDEEVIPRCHLAALNGEDFSNIPHIDPDIEDEFGRTLLHIACKANNVSAVKFMLHGCGVVDVMKEDSFGLTSLHYCCEPGAVSFRLDGRSSSSILRSDEKSEAKSSVHYLSVNLEILDELIRAGADLDYVPLHNGWTALCHACYVGDVEAVTALIHYGCDVNAGSQRYPLHTAVSGTRSTVVRILLENGADPNILGSSYDLSWSALHLAVHNDDLTTVKLLLDHGADPNIKDQNLHQTPLHLVNGINGAELVRLLISKGAHVNSLRKHDESPLHSACKNIIENVPVVVTLVELGADLNFRGRFNRTPLHYAAERGHAGIIKALVLSGADVNAHETAHKGEDVKDCYKSPLGSLLKYYHSLRKSRSENVIRACEAFTNAQSPDLLLDLGEDACFGVISELLDRCAPVILTLLPAVCGSTRPLLLHRDLVPELARYNILPWLWDNCELDQSLKDEIMRQYSHSSEFLTEVKRLKSVCRIAVRKQIRKWGRPMSKSVNDLPLPVILKSYLLLHH